MDVDGGTATPATATTTPTTATATTTGAAVGKRSNGRWLVGDLAVSRRRDGMEMKSPLVDGLLSDWDQVGG